MAQRRLFEAREAAEELSRRAAEAGASHAALMERAAALASEVQRLEEGLVEIEARAVALAAERDAARERVEALQVAIVEGEATLDREVRTLERCEDEVQAADDAVFALRMNADAQDAAIKDARAARSMRCGRPSRSSTSSASPPRAIWPTSPRRRSTAVQATLDDVLAEVAMLETAGDLTPDARVICADEAQTSDEDEEPLSGSEGRADSPGVGARCRQPPRWKALTAEEAIARLATRRSTGWVP